MSEVGDLYVVLRAVTEPFKKAIKEAAAEGEASSTRIGGAFKKLTGVGMVVGGAATIAIGATVKMAGDFQAEMTKLVTQAGVAKSQMGTLTDGVLQLAGQVGFSPTSLAESLFHVESNFESLGITAPKALELVKIAAEGAATGHADLVDVTNALTAAVASGIPGVQDYAQAMGVLNGIVGVGDMNMQDLANAFGSGMVATVKGFGLTIKDVGAALATFGDNNIRGSLAGNQLRMSVMALAKPVASAGGELKRLGLNSDTLAKDMRSGGLLKALEDLQQRFKANGVTAKEQGQVITELFGRKAGAGLNVLMDQLDRLKSKYPKLDEAATKFGDSWKGTQGTFNQQLKQTEQSLVAMGTKIGLVLLPYVQKFLGWIQQGVGWLTQHKSAVLALAGALGTALVAAIVAVGGALVAAFGPEEAIALGIMAIGAALVYAYNHFKVFHDIVNTVARVIGQVFSVAWRAAAAVIHWFATTVMPVVQRAINAVFAWFSAHKQIFIDAWHHVVNDVQQLVQWFNNTVLTWLKARLAELSAWWQAHSQEIERVWHATWAAIGQAVRLIWDGFINPALHQIVSTWNLVWGIIRDTFKLVWAVISGVVTTVMHQVMNIIAIVLDLITGKWGKAWQDVKKLVTQGLHDVVSLIANVGKSFGTLLWNAGVNLIKGLINGVKSMLGGFGSFLGGIGDFIKQHKGPPAKDRVLLEPAGRLLIEGLISGITGSMSHLQAELNHVTTKIGQWMREGLVHHKGYLADVIEKDDKRLLDLAARRDSVATRLKAAQKNLTAVQKEWAAAQKQVADSIMQSSTVVMDASQQGGWLSASQVLQNFQDQVTKTLQFAQYLKQAQANGLNGAMIQQIANAGVDSGFATAQALASASRGQIQQLNAMQQQMTGAANSVGNAAADSMYGAGLQAAKGLVKGLQSQEKAIEAQMLRIAKAMGDAIKRALRIKSPSQVFADLGVFIPQGLAVGIEQGTHHATRAISTLGQRVAQSARGLGMTGTGSAPAGQLPPIIVQVDRKTLFKIIQQDALRYNRRNPTNGLSLA